MRCNKAQELLSLEMDRMVPPDSTVKLEKHLENCADCQEYRGDLLMGRRLLAATEPELPDNFDWKLQLRLSQTLKEAAGEVAYPWAEERVDRWGWFRNFGAATAVGMAAILTFAIFLGPINPNRDGSSVAQNGGRTATEIASDRLPLSSPILMNGLRGGSRMQQQVSGMSMVPGAGGRLQLDRGWSGGDTKDLVTINQLKVENQKLARALHRTQMQLRMMQAKLDTNGSGALDLQE